MKKSGILPSSTSRIDRNALSDHYRIALMATMIGYLFIGKSFAYLGMPPLFIGEIMLVSGAVIFLASGKLFQTLQTITAKLLAVLMLWVTMRTVPYIGQYGFDALRDSLLVMYGAFVFFVMALILDDERGLEGFASRRLLPHDARIQSRAVLAANQRHDRRRAAGLWARIVVGAGGCACRSVSRIARSAARPLRCCSAGFRDRARRSHSFGRQAGSLCGGLRRHELHRISDRRPRSGQSVARAGMGVERAGIVPRHRRHRPVAAFIDRQQVAFTQHSATAIDAMYMLKSDAFDMKRVLLQDLIMEMAEILDRSWSSKKNTADGVTTTLIDEFYAVARQNGAIAGKVSRAGGGGFLMFMCAPEDRFGLVEALNTAGATAGAVKFTQQGCESWRTKA